jgi:hypothetical protein
LFVGASMFYLSYLWVFAYIVLSISSMADVL